MKKITLRFSSLVLACVPFLIAGSSIVQANDSVNNTAEETIQKNTADTTSDTTSSSKTEITKEIEKNETTPLPLTTKTIETTITNKGNDGVVFGNGTLTVAKYKEIELKGQFTPKKYNTIEIDKDGNWKALKAGTESITVEFTPDETTLALLKESYPDDNFNTPFKSEAIEVTVTSAEEVTPSSTTDSIETETVSVPLKLTESTLKTTEGTLAVQTTDGQKVTGEFTTIDKAEFTLKTDGTYTIPEAAQEKDLKETVTFTLNQASIDSLAKNEAYKDKNIETKYELEVTKKAQKNIVLTIKNKLDNTDLDGKGILIINDTVENIPDIKFVAKEDGFVPINNEFISVDKSGKWKALKAGETTINPEVTLSDETMKALQEKYPNMDLNITTEAVKVSIANTGTGSSTSNSKTYAPASNLPKTGEEKLRFAGIIGVIVILLAGALFLLKRNKNNDEE